MALDIPVKILLVEDDEDDFIIAQGLLAEIRGSTFALDWAKNFEQGLEALLRNEHDICVVDYRLGARNGIELLRAATEHKCQAPIILLTGLGEQAIDLEAMQAGAADYLVKAELRADSLGRSIRYALQRKRAAALAAADQARLAAFGADVGQAVAGREPLDVLLGHCVRAMAKHLNAALAEIATFDPEQKQMTTRAIAGPLAEGIQSPSKAPMVKLDIEALTTAGPLILNRLQNRGLVTDPDWFTRHQVCACAAYPLVIEEKLAGLMSLFSQQPLPERILQEMSAAASGIAHCIHRKQSREALDRSDDQIRKLAAFPRVNPNPVLEFSADGALTYVNEAARELARELGKEDLFAILPSQASQMVQECLATNQRKLRQEINIANRILSWSFFPISSSRVVHCYGADVTETVNLEAQLRHAQKLESVGQLAAGIAHDFNNLLTVIQGYAECLLSRKPEDPFTAAALKQVSLASQRAASLTRQLLTFSRKQVLQPQVLDLNALLKNLLKMIGRVVGEHIQVERHYASNLPSIEADAGMIEQVTMNLVVNSRDAMPNGGTLRISTTAARFAAGDLTRKTHVRPGSFVCLTVSDTGCGMDAKTLERIFEPFFTTKPVGKGTGLGLATVYGIVDQHKGWVEVTSQPGRGTTFKIYFPAAATEAQCVAATAQASPDIGCGRCETVFLVEDDPLLREFVREVLTESKYRVVEAASGAEALQTWEQMNGEVDLLLTDMVMPNGVSGWQLAKQLRKRRADLKVIFSSGYSEEVIGDDFDLERAWFLPKPYNPQQLTQMVRRCLDPSPASINPGVSASTRN